MKTVKIRPKPAKKDTKCHIYRNKNRLFSIIFFQQHSFRIACESMKMMSSFSVRKKIHFNSLALSNQYPNQTTNKKMMIIGITIFNKCDDSYRGLKPEDVTVNIFPFLDYRYTQFDQQRQQQQQAHVTDN